jgi:hypothetical protein
MSSLLPDETSESFKRKRTPEVEIERKTPRYMTPDELNHIFSSPDELIDFLEHSTDSGLDINELYLSISSVTYEFLSQKIEVLAESLAYYIKTKARGKSRDKICNCNLMFVGHGNDEIIDCKLNNNSSKTCVTSSAACGGYAFSRNFKTDKSIGEMLVSGNIDKSSIRETFTNTTLDFCKDIERYIRMLTLLKGHFEIAQAFVSSPENSGKKLDNYDELLLKFTKTLGEIEDPPEIGYLITRIKDIPGRKDNLVVKQCLRIINEKLADFNTEYRKCRRTLETKNNSFSTYAAISEESPIIPIKVIIGPRDITKIDRPGLYCVITPSDGIPDTIKNTINAMLFIICSSYTFANRKSYFENNYNGLLDQLQKNISYHSYDRTKPIQSFFDILIKDSPLGYVIDRIVGENVVPSFDTEPKKERVSVDVSNLILEISKYINIKHILLNQCRNGEIEGKIDRWPKLPGGKNRSKRQRRTKSKRQRRMTTRSYPTKRM